MSKYDTLPGAPRRIKIMVSTSYDCPKAQFIAKFYSRNIVSSSINDKHTLKKREKYDFRVIYLENNPHFPISAIYILKAYIV